jgi:hypothetical protein
MPATKYRVTLTAGEVEQLESLLLKSRSSARKQSVHVIEATCNAYRREATV